MKRVKEDGKVKAHKRSRERKANGNVELGRRSKNKGFTEGDKRKKN